MALFRLSVTQTKRSAGQSAIASAAYRAGERLYSEYYGEYSDYTRKGGVICSDIENSNSREQFFEWNLTGFKRSNHFGVCVVCSITSSQISRKGISHTVLFRRTLKGFDIALGNLNVGNARVLLHKLL